MAHERRGISTTTDHCRTSSRDRHCVLYAYDMRASRHQGIQGPCAQYTSSDTVREFKDLIERVHSIVRRCLLHKLALY